MIDISKTIGKYANDLDDIHYDYLNHEVQRQGINNTINSIIKIIDCTIIWKDDKTYIQTINWNYKHRIAQLIHLIENYGLTEKEQDAYYTRIIEQHNKNIEYEKLHPPVIYDKSKFKTKNKRKITKHKQTTIKSFDKPKKQSVAEKKLAAKVSKLNKLNINIKPVN